MIHVYFQEGVILGESRDSYDKETDETIPVWGNPIDREYGFSLQTFMFWCVLKDQWN